MARMYRALAIQRRLLIANQRGNRHRPGTYGARRRLRHRPARTDQYREHLARRAEHGQHFIVPLQSLEVEQHSARGVGVVGNEAGAFREPEREPRLDGSEAKLPAFGARTPGGPLVENPLELGPGEIRINRQAGALGPLRFASPQRFADTRTAAALPHDRAMERSARPPLPEQERFPLVSDSDPAQVAG